jgi:hypothetical protein
MISPRATIHAGRQIPGLWRVSRADERIRTADPFITSEVLYQLSYVGAGRSLIGRSRTGSR